MAMHRNHFKNFIRDRVVPVTVIIGMGVLIASTFQNHVSFADAAEAPQVLLTGKSLDFKSPPYLVGDILMVPAQETMDKLGLQERSFNDGKNIVGYKNNVYVKVLPGKYGYRNGKPYRLKSDAIMNKGTLYAPLLFFTKSYDYQVAESNNTYKITHDGNGGRFTLMDDIYYKTYDVDPLDVSLALPDYWEPTDKTGLKYGFKDDYENSQLDITLAPRTSGDLSMIVENYIESNILLKNVFQVQSVTKQRLDTFDSALITAVGKTAETKESLYIYLIKAENQLYILKFSDKGSIGNTQTKTLYRNIAKNFKVNKLSVDYDDEYFIEYPMMRSQDVSFTSKLYSSLLVENVFPVSGTVSPESPYKRMIAFVKRDNESSYFNIPIKDGKFNGKIYAPFGLGRHQITLFFVPEGTEADEYGSILRDSKYKVLELTVINTAFNQLKYLTPSTLVNADDPTIVNRSVATTHKHIKRLDKARDLFIWLSQNYTMMTNQSASPATAVLKEKAGNEKDLNILYTALLRASGIPSRIASGELDGRLHYWTEIEINGIWIVSDIVSGYRYKEDLTLSLGHFSLNLRQYYENREDIKIFTD